MQCMCWFLLSPTCDVDSYSVGFPRKLKLHRRFTTKQHSLIVSSAQFPLYSLFSLSAYKLSTHVATCFSGFHIWLLPKGWGIKQNPKRTFTLPNELLFLVLCYKTLNTTIRMPRCPLYLKGSFLCGHKLLLSYLLVLQLHC